MKRYIVGDDAQAQMHKDNYLSINTIQNTLKRVLFLFRFGSLAGVANLCRETNTDEWQKAFFEEIFHIGKCR